MSNIVATPIVDEKFWIVEEDGTRIATLHKIENNKFLLSNTAGEIMFNEKDELTAHFGSNFFLINHAKPAIVEPDLHECHGFPTSCKPYHEMYDVTRNLPLFTKSRQSKSIFCAGYYRIKFDYYWNASLCPKLITVDRYQTLGPYKTEAELKQAREHDKSN